MSVEEIKGVIDWGNPNLIVSVGPGQTARAIDLKELARQTGYSFTTLRYYIRHGLIEQVHSKANYLVFSDHPWSNASALSNFATWGSRLRK